MSSSSFIETQIESVTVFSYGALVCRRGSLPVGQRTVRVEELPLGLIDDSVQVSLQGAASGLAAFQVSVGLQATGTVEKAALTLELEDLAREQGVLLLKLEYNEILLSTLNSTKSPIRQTPKESAPPPLQLKTQFAFMDFQAEQAQVIVEELAEQRERLRVVSERLAELREIERCKASEVKPEDLRKYIEVHLTEENDSEPAMLCLSYRIDGARWTPTYTARFNPELDRVQFSMRAIVAQCSEEDWSSVKISVCTSNPTVWRECPELKSQRLARAQASPLGPSWRPPPLGTSELFRSYDQSKPPTTFTPAPVLPPAPPAQREALLSSPDWLGGEGGGYADKASLDDADDSWIEEPAPSVFGSAPRGRAAMDRRDSPLKKRKMEFARSVAPDEVEKESYVESIFTLDQRMWQFGQLRMMGAGHHRRGELLWYSETQTYTESYSINASIVKSAIASRDHSTTILLAHGKPSGHSTPGPVDGFDYKYEAQGLVDVPADGQNHTIPLIEFEKECQPYYITVPRESLAVFRTSKFANPQDVALLAGPVDILIGEEFLHTASLESVNPSGDLELGLGVTESIKITRKTHFHEGTSGLMGGTTVLPHRVELEAVNHLQRGITLEIRDRLPEVDEEYKSDIKVELVKVEPPWEEFIQESSPEMKSAHRWFLEVPSQKAANVSLSYNVSNPSKYELVGGNRREVMS